MDIDNELNIFLNTLDPEKLILFLGYKYLEYMAYFLENNNRSFTYENFVRLGFNDIRKESKADKGFRTNVIDGFFIFARNYKSSLKMYGFDYFMLDVYNKFGKGNEAIYIIPRLTDTIEDACFVATDIVDFIRKICEDEPFDLTLVGKN